MLEETIKSFHNAAADAHGSRKETLLKEAMTRYEALVRDYPSNADIAAPAMLGLANVSASLGRTNDAVRHFAAMAEKFPARDWDVLQAWKSAGDLCRESGRHAEARQFYARIVERYERPDSPAIVQAVVRGAKSHLAE